MFHLDNKQKTKCPACGRSKCFSPYVYDDTRQAVDAAACGKCDRLDNCSYHLPPREYFKAHPDSGRRRRVAPFVVSHTPPPPVSFVDPGAMLTTMRRPMDGNPLYRYMTRLYADIDGARRAINLVFRLYNVGTSPKWDGAAVFWQVDDRGRVRDGKLMGYDPRTGRRVKKPYPQVNWVSTLLKKGDATNRRTYFGASVAARFADAVLLVFESEKTALQTAVAMVLISPLGPRAFEHVVPIAVGGCEGLRSGSKMDLSDPFAKEYVLRGRQVVLVPDQGKYVTWDEHARAYRADKWTRSVRTSTIMERPSPVIKPGDDFEDLMRFPLDTFGTDALPVLAALIAAV